MPRDCCFSEASALAPLLAVRIASFNVSSAVLSSLRASLYTTWLQTDMLFRHGNYAQLSEPACEHDRSAAVKWIMAAPHSQVSSFKGLFQGRSSSWKANRIADVDLSARLPNTLTPQGLVDLQRSPDRVKFLSALSNLALNEQKVYAQNGEDGVLQALFRLLGTTNRFTVEFGAGCREECNTNLLREYGWGGFTMDGQECDPVPPDHHREFISASNIMQLLEKHGAPSTFDLLSIDMDGQDFWVWQAIDEQRFMARVVVAEYNNAIHPHDAVSIVYDEDFRHKHKSPTGYYGASATAMQRLAASKGYSLVYIESRGCNMFFVHHSALGADLTLHPWFNSQSLMMRAYTKYHEAAVDFPFWVPITTGREAKVGWLSCGPQHPFESEPADCRKLVGLTDVLYQGVALGSAALGFSAISGG